MAVVAEAVAMVDIAGVVVEGGIVPEASVAGTVVGTVPEVSVVGTVVVVAGIEDVVAAAGTVLVDAAAETVLEVAAAEIVALIAAVETGLEVVVAGIVVEAAAGTEDAVDLVEIVD